MDSVSKSDAGATPEDSRWRLFYDVTPKIDRKHYWHVIRNERIFSMLEKTVPDLKGASYLEVGCGVANVLGFLLEHGVKDCTGWDINQYALDIASKRYPSAHFAQHDLLLPMREHETFDVVGMFDVLEHVEDDLAILESVRALLRPGGTLILTVPAHNLLWSYYDEFFGHFRRYEKHQLAKALTSAGFNDLKLVYIMAPLFPAVLAFRKRLKYRELSERQLEDLFEHDVRLPNPILNEIIKSIFRLEHKLLGDHDLGFGASLLAAAKVGDT